MTHTVLMRITLRVLGWVSSISVGILFGCSTPPNQGSSGSVPKPAIYDGTADGEAQLAAALDEARQTDKRVLLSLGANWCSDSQKMYRLLRDNSDIVSIMKESYVLAMVDVNRRNGPPRNAPLVTRFGDPLKRGIPVLLVLSPEGELLNSKPSERLKDHDHKRPRRVAKYLKKWAP